MKKLVITAAALLVAVAASATGTIDVKGVTYAVDTLFHAKIGPGTTQTTLNLTAASNPLRVHYLTIDKTTPGVSIRAVCAKDKVAGTARTSDMAASRTRAGLDYFCGVNADFFTTSGTATNGSSVVGTPTTSTIVDGEIYKSSTANYQFVVDTAGRALITRLNYYQGTATIGDKVTLFKGVNVMSPNNGITVYTPRYWGTANQVSYADNCWQVTARLAQCSPAFTAGAKFRLEVTSEPASDGDMAIPADGFVIHGRGTSTTGCNTGAKDFVGALKTGDIVEFDNLILDSDGNSIVPYTVVSGNPKNVGGGLTLDTEAERADAKDRHPRTCIGVNADNSKVIMMVVDGRASHSVGVSTSMLADIMRYAGGAEAVNLDGGGSSTLYTHAIGVRNTCSDGSERAVGNAVFAVLEAPEDNEIVEIAFADFRRDVPAYGIYTPVIYGYNKYGKLIDTDVKGCTLSSPAGDTSADGCSLIPTVAGLHPLTATLGALTATMPVNVIPLADVKAQCTSVLLNGTRTYPANVTTGEGDNTMALNNDALKWTTADAAVATVDAHGVIAGVEDGATTVTGTLGDLEINIDVAVEIPHQATMPAATGTDWEAGSKTQIKTAEVTPNGNGFTLDFELSSTRTPSVGVNVKKVLRSHPEAVTMDLKPDNANITKVVLYVKANNATRDVAITRTLDDGTAQQKLTFDLSEGFDLDEVPIYPIELSRVLFYPKGSTGTVYKLDVPQVDAVYDPSTLGVEDITVPASASDGVLYDLQGRPAPAAPAPGLYISAGRKILVR